MPITVIVDAVDEAAIAERGGKGAGPTGEGAGPTGEGDDLADHPLVTTLLTPCSASPGRSRLRRTRVSHRLLDHAGYDIVHNGKTQTRRPAYRLYHESLAEHLRKHRNHRADQGTIADVLTAHTPPTGRPLRARLAPGRRDHPIPAAAAVVGPLGEVRPQHPHRVLRGHTGKVFAVHGRCARSRSHGGMGGAISARDDRTIRLWDLGTCAGGAAPLVGPTDWVRSLAATEVDGRPVLASGGDHRTVRVWDRPSVDGFGPVMREHTDGGTRAGKDHNGWSPDRGERRR